MCVHAFDNGTQWSCMSYLNPHRLVPLLTSTPQTKCTLLLVKIPLAGWRCTFQSLLSSSHRTSRTRTPSSGFGASMTTSQMVIMWPNKDGFVTVSQRKASSHTQPQVDPAPQRIAQPYLALSAVSNCIFLYLQKQAIRSIAIFFSFLSFFCSFPLYRHRFSFLAFLRSFFLPPRWRSPLDS